MKLGFDDSAHLGLTPLERAVLGAFAARLGAPGATLLQQRDGATVVNRSHSGVGFVTRLAVPAEIPALGADGAAAAGRSGPLYASHPALGAPAEFLVQVKAGRVASIEAYCHEGMWPAEEAGFRLGESRG